ncbi:hypothetical protein PFICI_07654 [Pestalotiopsis fici W106-1]|uniref:Uncharacterized protein n=1 Tax=Pestalotiopsis fici (strain W106-1 / CGMCC3.15140) TaxID=1229662 RepID=W3X220_PESFW|nr:uncharacterized protein PFICI_07654 [Pestalotiopsis fici W106-1]ETS80125.1 hypothetical protein PFICI_07654 [Pestalotiopsis fici W106-1]
MAPKRAVFADKSNTLRTTTSFKDESKVPDVKVQVVKALENPIPAKATQKDAFLRPAQRPSSKGNTFLPSAQNNGYIQPLTGVVSNAPSQAATKLPKRASTSIYNDNDDSNNSNNNDSRPTTAESGTVVTHHIEAADAVRTTSTIFPRKPRHYQSQPALKSMQQKQQQVVSLLDTDINNLAHWEPLPAAKNIIEDDVAQTPYLDAVEELSPEQCPILQPRKVDSSLSIRDPESEPESRSESVIHNINYQDECLISAADLLEHELSDHEDEDFYDIDQGYTTAHTYRSTDDAVHPDVGDLLEAEAEPSVTMTVMDAPKFSKQTLDEIEAARVHVEKNRTTEEVEDERWDISMVAEYGDEIFEYMKEMEIALLPSAHYMDIQTEIQWSMRSVLMDWVIQVHGRFNLLPETLFLAVNFIDRFLSVKVVSLGKLQLVGATALFLAAKYEEINCPSVQEIVYMVENSYSVDEILKAERYMLSMLNFDLGFPGPMSFLRRISKADDYDLETRTLAKYFLEVTIMDERFVACPPSFLAAGSHCLSRLILEKGKWTTEHVHYSGYTFAQLQPMISMILECCTIAKKHHQAVFEKYSDKRYKRCAAYVESQLKSGFYLEAPPQSMVPAPNGRYESLPPTWGPSTVPYERSYMRMPIPLQG